MREQLEVRLKELEGEFEKGQSMLREAERQRAELEATLLRIDGAITALRELIAEANGVPGGERAPEPESVAPAAP